MSSEKNGGDDHGGHDTSEKHLLTSPVDRFLSDRLKDCLRSASLADIHFVTDDGTVKAHQCILSCSPVLRQLFQSVEQKLMTQVTVLLAGFHRKSVLALLKFLYTGQIDLIKKTTICLEFQQLAKHLAIDPPVNKFRKSSTHENFVCDRCGKKFGLKANLKFHKKKFHEGKERSSKEQKGEKRKHSEEVPVEVVKDKKDSSKSIKKEPDDADIKPVLEEPGPRPVDAEDVEKRELDNSLTNDQEPTKEPEGPPEVDGSKDCTSSFRHQTQILQVAAKDLISAQSEEENCGNRVQKDDDFSDSLEEKDLGVAVVADPEGFQMPADFDIPEEVVKTQAEQSGRAAYAVINSPRANDSSSSNQHSRRVSVDFDPAFGTQPVVVLEGLVKPLDENSDSVQENQVDSTSGRGNSHGRDDLSDSAVSESSGDDDATKKKEHKKTPAKHQRNSEKSPVKTPAKKDENQLMESLFGREESDQDKKETKKSSKEEPDVASKLQEELEAKRKRTLQALKSSYSGDDEGSKRRKMRKLQMRHRERRRKRQKHREDEPEHVCTSACPGNHAMSDEDNWLDVDTDNEDKQWAPSAHDVDDDDDVTATDDEGEDYATSSEETSDEHEKEKTKQRSRQDRHMERMEKAQLGWIERGNGRKIKVSVQNEGLDPIVELRLYRMNLLKTTDSESDSDDESTRSKRESDSGNKTNSRKRIRIAFDDDQDDSTSSNDEDASGVERKTSSKKLKYSSPVSRSLSLTSSPTKSSHSAPTKKSSPSPSTPKDPSSSRSLKRSFSEHRPRASSMWSKHEDKFRELKHQKELKQARREEGARKNLSDLFEPGFKHHYGTSTEKDCAKLDPRSSEIMKMSFKKKSTTEATPQSRKAQDRKGDEVGGKIKRILSDSSD